MGADIRKAIRQKCSGTCSGREKLIGEDRKMIMEQPL